MGKLLVLLLLLAGCAHDPGFSKEELAANILAIKCGHFCEVVQSGKLLQDAREIYMADGKIRLTCECVPAQKTTDIQSVNPSVLSSEGK